MTAANCSSKPWRQAREAVSFPSAGFATAMELFPGLMRLERRPCLNCWCCFTCTSPGRPEDYVEELIDPYRDPRATADLTQAVEELVRATLLLADVSRLAPERRRARRQGRAGTADAAPP